MQKKAAQDRFKDYLRKIGSGMETGRSLSRKESADALELILNGVPTEAQIGAFMIAHRIRRPEAQELAGMIDTYKALGPSFKSHKSQTNPICFGMPFDGRKRTSPIYPLTTLMLLSERQPVVLQGGSRMPVKYGITTEELFRSLGLNLKGIAMQNVESGFLLNGLAFIYQPDHFPLAENLIHFREEIGKRPPLASMELLWTSHNGEHLNVSGFVHTPTEMRHWQTLKLLGETNIITIKGLEGSTDLPINGSCVATRIMGNHSERITLRPTDYGYKTKAVPWTNLKEWQNLSLQALNNLGPLKETLIWNAGVYLWFAGLTKSLQDGLEKAKFVLSSGAAKKKLEELIDWRSKLDLDT